ncbi:MAG: EamA family transporter, partial [Proteobacteria bacterium]|nr:EamA family transporter [Pseudomonadota bacterium]
MTPRDILLAIAVAALWGFAFVPIRLGVGEMPPLVLTALRFFFSALPFAFFLKPPKAPAMIVIGFGAVLGIIKFGLLFTGMKLGMPAGLSSLIMQMQVFFTILLAALIARETPTRLQIIAIAVALGGVAIIAFSNDRGAPLLPFLMVLLASFFWGVANMLARRAGGADMLAFVVWASLVPPLPLIAL